MAAYNQPSSSGGNAGIIIVAMLIIALAVVGAIWLMQDHRSASQRVGDAVEAVPQGLGKAADKLGDQPPAQNVTDNLKDAAKK